jgi:hypothetical protein
VGPCRWLALRSPLWHLNTPPAIENGTSAPAIPSVPASSRSKDSSKSRPRLRRVTWPEGHPGDTQRRRGRSRARLGPISASALGWANTSARSEVGQTLGVAALATSTSVVAVARPKTAPVASTRPSRGGVPIHRALDVRDDLTGIRLVPAPAPNGFGPRDITPGTAQDNVGGNVYWTTTQNYRRRCRLFRPTRS